MEELLTALKALGAIRSIGSYSEYEPDGKHKNTIFFDEDTKKIYLNGHNYGGSNVDDSGENNQSSSEPIIINEISFYELYVYAISDNSNPLDPEIFTSIYNKAKQAIEENRQLIMKGSPNNDENVADNCVELNKSRTGNTIILTGFLGAIIYIMMNSNGNDLSGGILDIEEITSKITSLESRISALEQRPNIQYVETMPETTTPNTLYVSPEA